MRRIGHLMIAAGFLAGALVAVLDELNVQWGRFLPALVLGAAGVSLVRLAKRRKALSEGKTTSNVEHLASGLSRIVEKMTALNAEKQSIDPYHVRQRIDELFPEDLAAFVEARESIAQGHGLQAYADVMTHFAAGERYLNRAWSASADGYIDEVNTYLDKAQAQFAEALERIRQLRRQTVEIGAWKPA